MRGTRGGVGDLPLATEWVTLKAVRRPRPSLFPQFDEEPLDQFRFLHAAGYPRCGSHVRIEGAGVAGTGNVAPRADDGSD